MLIYFAEAAQRLYQLAQWLPVMERVAATYRVACVLRSRRRLACVAPATALPLALLQTYDDLMAFYERGQGQGDHLCEPRAAQLPWLTARTALHVHVDRGESDKRSSLSNQAKAYDRVFVAGDVAARRYLDNVLEFEERRPRHGRPPPLDSPPAADRARR